MLLLVLSFVLPSQMPEDWAASAVIFKDLISRCRIHSRLFEKADCFNQGKAPDGLG
jgi:hypothetical protein